MLNTSHFETYDSRSFRQFCGPAQVHKDLSTLYGLIVGIQADGHIDDSEIRLLRAWIESVSSLQTKAPFNKFVAKINAIISDGVVTGEEAEDLIWLCKNYLDYNRNPLSYLYKISILKKTKKVRRIAHALHLTS